MILINKLFGIIDFGGETANLAVFFVSNLVEMIPLIQMSYRILSIYFHPR
ncbi:MAG: hypothetical protein ACRDBN_02020 [Lactococcus cremoris]